MFRRNNRNDILPSTHYGTGRGSSGGGLPAFSGSSGGFNDGSGRSIKMDAPVIKAWKKASGYTRGSYYALAFTIFLIYYGYRSLSYWNGTSKIVFVDGFFRGIRNLPMQYLTFLVFLSFFWINESASIWLTCHQQECTLEITPPGTRTKTVVFPRDQLHSAQAIKTDKTGSFISLDTDKYEPPSKRKKKKKKNNSGWHHRGPDAQGRYKTYRVNFLKERPEDDKRSRPDLDFTDFSELGKYISISENDMFTLHFRHFSLSQSRMRVRSNVNKVESYVKRRRQKLIIKESANLPWQGIVCLVFGLVGCLLTLLIGQFWDEEPRRQGGPGARRSQQKPSSSYRKTGSSPRMPSRPKASPYQSKKYWAKSTIQQSRYGPTCSAI